jgi:MraZ protein
MDVDDEFFGHFDHTIDEKGRLVLPAAYRGTLGPGGFITYLGDYAALFTRAGWDLHRQRLRDSGHFSTEEMQYINSLTTPFTPDAQHRVSIPSDLREEVGLAREVTIVGSTDHAAIYARDAWAEVRARMSRPVDTGGVPLRDKFKKVDPA